MPATTPPPDFTPLLTPLLTPPLPPPPILHQTLETLINLTRSPHHHHHHFSYIIPSLLHHLSSPLPRLTSLLILRFLRNLCAGDETNVQSFVNHDGVEIVSNLIGEAVRVEEEEEEEEKGVGVGVVRVGLQVIANVVVASGGNSRVRVWRGVGFGEVSKVMRREVCDVLCRVFYLCCEDEVVFGAVCRGEGVAVVAEIVRSVSLVGYGEDWIKLLLWRVCLEEPYFPALFNALSVGTGSQESEDTDQSVGNLSQEQAFLLRIVSVILNERLEEFHVGTEFVLFVLGLFKASVEKVDFTTRGSSVLPTGVPSIDVLGYSLSILRDSCASLGSEEVVDTASSNGLLDLLLHLLGKLEPPSTIRKAMKQDQSLSSGTLKVCPYKGFRKDIVSVISNCLYGRRKVQDEIRAKNAVLLLLQQCVLDEDNPFLREWGIWCVRNLLEGNEENQKLVAELELQGSANVPEIAGLGLRVEVDQNTRRAKLVNIT
ncbi:hypothetical protein Drorol1_Dr00000456 [Drosera rotundifolia]